MTTDRRTRFREYMKRFDPTTDPEQPFRSGFYVEPPDGIGTKIATRLELEPTSTHLLVGGIGSGKTTELLAIATRLNNVPDIAVFRQDVLTRQRVDKLEPGVLLALAAEAIVAQWHSEFKEPGEPKDPGAASALKTITTLIGGHWQEPDPQDYEGEGEGDSEWVPGIIQSPLSTGRVDYLSEHVVPLAKQLSKRIVMLFDGLDRLWDT